MPKGTWVGWKSVNQRNVSRLVDIGFGGLFLSTTKPADANSTIEMNFELASGQVRARAVVRYTEADKGMGLEFVQMRPEDRNRLAQFLKAQGIGVNEVPVAPSEEAKKPAAEIFDPALFEAEVKQLLEVAARGTYYQLLGVTPESSSNQVKKSFYTMARKFHPDHHMNQPEIVASLKDLMGVVTEGYKTLTDAEKRSLYDKRLAESGSFGLRRDKTEGQETIEVCFARATECLRAKNFPGSITWLRKCAEIAPDDPKYQALLARSLATVASFRVDAIRHFERAVDLDPLNVRTYLEFAKVYEDMELPWRARPLYSKVLEIDPANARARVKLDEMDSTSKKKTSSVVSRMFGNRN
jgi:tetratricopeptide (TPR) repeat protein